MARRGSGIVLRGSVDFVNNFVRILDLDNNLYEFVNLTITVDYGFNSFSSPDFGVNNIEREFYDTH